MQDYFNFVYDKKGQRPEDCQNGKITSTCLKGYHLAIQTICNINNITTATYNLQNDSIPCSFFYPIHTWSLLKLLQNINSFSELLPQPVYEALRQKHCILILTDWHEKCTIHACKHVRKQIIKLCQQDKINLEYILHLHNTSNALNNSSFEKEYDNKKELVSVGNNFFITVVREWALQNNILNKFSIRFNNIINKKYFDNIFICLNRIPRSHRCWFVYEMWKNNLIQKNKVLCSFTAKIDSKMVYENDFSQLRDDYNNTNPFFNFLKQISDIENINDQVFFKQFLTKEEKNKFANFCSILPLIVDTNEHSVNHWSTFSDQLLTSAGIYIVTETAFFTSDNSSQFLTEKIFKPIVYLMPFIVLGEPLSLAALRSVGFRTFGKFWDESYDYEFNNEKRLYMVLELVKDICSKSKEEINLMLQQMLPDLFYNYNLLFQLKPETNLIEVLKVKQKLLSS